MGENLSLNIQDKNEIEIASTFLHDAVFRDQDIQFDPDAKKFTLSFWRELPEVKRTTRVWFVFQKTKYLRAACNLTVFDVKSVDIQVRDKLHYYSVFRLDYRSEGQSVHFETEGAIGITLHVERLAGRLVDTGERTWEQFGYSTITGF